MFYDDGEGYLDLGTDNVFEFDDEGRLIGENDHTWLAINGHVVSYNYEGTTVDDDAYTIVGSVPCMINDVRANLILVFDSENEDGYVAGARYDYHDGETDTIAKGVTELNVGDQIDFLCDYYAYDGTYQDTYFLGDPFTVTEEMEITNISLGDADLYATYRFSDIYNQNYWTTPMD